MSYYECLRCKYKSLRNSDMKRHLERKVKCPRNIESIKYNDEEIYNLSMIIHKNEKIETVKPIKKDLLCMHCNKSFTRLDNLKKHEKSTCKFKNKINEKNIDIDKNNNDINIKDDNNEKNIDNSKNTINIENNIKNIDNKLSMDNQTNIHNKTYIENQTNNIIIINPNNNLQPFDNNWTIEHIDNYLRQLILLSDNKYTNLLDEILKNKNNLNVIIDKDSHSGLVYKNKDDLYVNMKVKEIIKVSMEKLYQQLNGFYTTLLDNNTIINSNIIDNLKENLDNKFDDFCNNNNTQNIVSDLLTSIYEKNKLEAIEISENILNNNKIGY